MRDGRGFSACSGGDCSREAAGNQDQKPDGIFVFSQLDLMAPRFTVRAGGARFLVLTGRTWRLLSQRAAPVVFAALALRVGEQGLEGRGLETELCPSRSFPETPGLTVSRPAGQMCVMTAPSCGQAGKSSLPAGTSFLQ